MAALVIGRAQHEQIAELRHMATASPFLDLPAALATATGSIDAYRDMMAAFTIELPIGFRVTYTIERQPKAPPPGLCHHLSVSVDRHGKMPHPEAVETILQAFGMQPLRQSKGIWTELVEPGRKAVNVLQLVRQPAAG